MLYNEDINYYFRINFAGFEQLINALGGVTVNSDYEFDSKNIIGYHYNKGENFLNGEQALVFSREPFQKVIVSVAKTRWQLLRALLIKLFHRSF